MTSPIINHPEEKERIESVICHQLAQLPHTFSSVFNEMLQELVTVIDCKPQRVGILF